MRYAGDQKGVTWFFSSLVGPVAFGHKITVQLRETSSTVSVTYSQSCVSGPFSQPAPVRFLFPITCRHGFIHCKNTFIHDQLLRQICHITDGHHKLSHHRPSVAIFIVTGGSPWTKYGCHRWSPRTICGAVGGLPLPQMVPFIETMYVKAIDRATINHYQLFIDCFMLYLKRPHALLKYVVWYCGLLCTWLFY